MSIPENYHNHVRGERADEMRERERTLVVLGDASDLDVIFVVAIVAILCNTALAPSTHISRVRCTSGDEVDKRWHRSVGIVHFLEKWIS